MFTSASTVAVARASYDVGQLEELLSRLLLGTLGPGESLLRAGERVLLKPNWVLHRNLGNGGMSCMVTHPAMIEAVVRFVSGFQPREIIIADAPVQGCRWESLVDPRLEAVLRSAAGDIPLRLLDLRRQILRSGLERGHDIGALDDESYALFNLGADSLLEPISRSGPFRVTMYDPRRLADNHRPGVHRYLIAKVPLEADLVINLPKLKTHRKAGITAALKNLVGINGNKDYLPHHRAGSPREGGDCYPDSSAVKRLGEYLLDTANKRIGRRSSRYLRFTASGILSINAHLRASLSRKPNLSFRENVLLHRDVEGGWSGNDTTWRMCLDLNRILLFGRPDGSMSDTRQRRVLHICDGVIAGQGEGPLSPEPLELGVVTCSASGAAADWVHCELLGIDPAKIPIVREAFGSFRWPLVETTEVFIRNLDNSATRQSSRLETIRQPALLPRGWRGHCEKTTP